MAAGDEDTADRLGRCLCVEAVPGMFGTMAHTLAYRLQEIAMQLSDLLDGKKPDKAAIEEIMSWRVPI